jgi:hypothetical protein
MEDSTNVKSGIVGIHMSWLPAKQILTERNFKETELSLICNC